MPGVRITQGADLRFPPGAIRISINDEGQPVLEPVVPHLRTDMWPQWLMEAVEAAQSARMAEAEVSRLAGESVRDEEALDVAMSAELRASMRTITASAFAIDAFYASIKARSPAHPDADKWSAHRTPRYAQVFEMVRFSLKLKEPGALEIRNRIKEMFRFRDWAVHPGSRFREPIYREDVDSGVDWHFAAFRKDNAVRGVAKTMSMMDALVEQIPRGCEELSQTYPSARRALDMILAAYDAAGLPGFDRARPVPHDPE